MLLNIYYFRFNIFDKGTFKRLFEKKGTLSEKFGEAGTPSAPLPSLCSGAPVKWYEVKIKMVQKQWLQLKLKFLPDCKMKIII